MKVFGTELMPELEAGKIVHRSDALRRRQDAWPESYPDLPT